MTTKTDSSATTIVGKITVTPYPLEYLARPVPPQVATILVVGND